MWCQNTQFLIQSGPKTFYGNFEIELWKPQWNVAFLIQLKNKVIFLIPGQDLRESRSKIQFKAEAVWFAHDFLRFELCESQWLTFQLRISRN